MKNKTTVNGLKVAAKEWKGKRIYFQVGRNQGHACWDIEKKCFIKCHGRVGARFEHAIKIAFELE